MNKKWKELFDFSRLIVIIQIIGKSKMTRIVTRITLNVVSVIENTKVGRTLEVTRCNLKGQRAHLYSVILPTMD